MTTEIKKDHYFAEQYWNRPSNFNRTLVFYSIVVSKHTILSSAPTKDTNPPQSIDIIMRNREKLLLWNEKRKFVIRRRFPPLLFLSLLLWAAFTRARARLPLVLRAGLFLSMLATLFSLLYPPELGLSCLFEWTMAPLHGGWIQPSINGGRQKGWSLESRWETGRWCLRLYCIDSMLLFLQWRMVRANYFLFLFIVLIVYGLLFHGAYFSLMYWRW